MIKTRKGFTLVELLVVVAIIAVLSAVGLSLFTNAQRKSRDARRREELKQIQNAAEQYYLANNAYPTVVTGAPGLDDFMQNNVVPTDPRDSGAYDYTLTATTYTICADLELTAAGVVDIWPRDGSDDDVCVYQLQ